MSALPPKADIAEHDRNVRVVPLADFASVQQAGFSPCFGEWAERGGGSAAAELSRTNIMLGRGLHPRGRGMIERIRVEPISTYLERYRKGGVAHPVTIANGFVYLSGLPPFDPESGEIKPQPFERQCELVLEQIKHCLEAAGSSLTQVIKCNVYCVPARRASRPSTPCMTGISRKTRHRASSCSFIRGRGRSTLKWIAWRRCNAVGS